MSDWEESADEAPAKAPAPAPVPTTKLPTKAKSKFADEDAEEENVKDDWEESDEEEPAKGNGTVSAPAPIRRKGITKQKIAEKEAAEAQRQATLEARAAEDADPSKRKARERAQQMQSDLANAKSLFGDFTTESSSDILSSNPKTKEEFTAFADTLADFIISKHGNKPLYAAFVEEFAKALCDPLKDVQIRKASSTLSAFANEKQRQAKEAAGAGKKKKAAAKPALPSAKGVYADYGSYDDVLDDDDDDFI